MIEIISNGSYQTDIARNQKFLCISYGSYHSYHSYHIIIYIEVGGAGRTQYPKTQYYTDVPGT